MAKQGQIHFSITGNNSDFLAKIRQNNQAIKDGANITEKASAQMRSAVMGIGAAIGIGFGIDQIRQFCGELINVRGQFQTFESVLTNTFGDKNKAKESMEMIQNFAATTPFQVDALTGSFVKLVNQGFTPTHKQMTLLGDLASSTGKGFDQLTEAIIDAQTGEFERLKEFGIRASKEGDKVTFNFKEQATQVDFTASSIREYILSLGELEGVQGSNAAIAATLTGQVSNLQDSITQMMNEIGQSSEGVLSGAISSASFLVEHYEGFGKTLAVIIGLYGSYKAAIILYSAAQKAANVAGSVKAFMQLATSIKSAKDAQLLLNMATNANPYVLLASAVTTAIAAFVLFRDRTSDATKAANKLSKEIRDETKLLDESYGSIKKSAEGTDDRRKAIEDFNSKYNSYLNNLLTEKSTMEEVAIAYDKAKTGIVDYQLAQAKDSYTSEAQENYIKAEKNYGNVIGDWGKELSTNEQRGKFAAYAAQLKESIKNGNKATLEDIKNAYDASMSEVNYESVEQFLEAISSGKDHSRLSDTIAKYGGVGGGISLDQLNRAAEELLAKEAEYEHFAKGFKSTIKQKTVDPAEEPNYGADYKAAQKEWDEAKKAYEAIEKDRDSVSTKAYNDAKTRLEIASKSFKDLGGETSGKSISPITDDDKKLIEGSIGWYEAQISKLQTLRKSLSDPNNIAAVNSNIQQMQVAMGILEDEANVGTIDKEALSMTDEYAERERKAFDERLANFQTFAERYQAIDDEHKSNLELVSAKGGDQSDIDSENQRYEDDLQSLNDEVLATIDDFESLGVEATDRVINDMIATLTKTKADLEGDTSGANNTTKIKAVNAELERLKKLKEDNDQPTKGRSLKEWQDMEKQLKDCVGSFNEIGDAVGGVAGEVISTAGSIAGSTISMVSSIAQLVDISINGTKAAAEGASKSIQAVESASVILAVISAVIQVATKIAALFAANKKAEEDNQKALREVTERNINAQSQYNALLREEATLLAEIGSIFGDDPYALAIANTERYSGAISELRTDLSKLNDIDIVTGSHTEKKWFLGTKKQIDDYSSIASVYEDLVDEYGNLNVERAQTIIDTQKMSDEDKERLEGLIKLQKEADEAIEGVNDYYRDIFGEMGSSLKDALVDAFRNGTDAGEAFCKNMVGMLEKLGEDFAYSMSIGQVMAEQQVKIDEINKDTTLTDKERADKLMALAIETGEKAAAQQDDFNAYLEAYQKGANKEGYKLWEADEGADRTATAKGIATASQDSVDENNAIGRTQLGYMSGIHDGVHNFIIPDLAKVRESFALMQGNLVDQLVELRGIRENTNCLPKMGEDISVMKAGVKNLVTKVENL